MAPRQDAGDPADRDECGGIEMASWEAGLQTTLTWKKRNMTFP